MSLRISRKSYWPSSIANPLILCYTTPSDRTRFIDKCGCRFFVMTKLPSKSEIQSHHRDALQLALCERDHELLAEHQPLIFAEMCKMIQAGATPRDVKLAAMQMIKDEAVLIQRLHNAARYEAEG